MNARTRRKQKAKRSKKLEAWRAARAMWLWLIKWSCRIESKFGTGLLGESDRPIITPRSAERIMRDSGVRPCVVAQLRSAVRGHSPPMWSSFHSGRATCASTLAEVEAEAMAWARTLPLETT